MYRQAYLELQALRETNPELAEKVASEILGNIEKTAGLGKILKGDNVAAARAKADSFRDIDLAKFNKQYEEAQGKASILYDSVKKAPDLRSFSEKNYRYKRNLLDVMDLEQKAPGLEAEYAALEEAFGKEKAKMIAARIGVGGGAAIGAGLGVNHMVNKKREEEMPKAASERNGEGMYREASLELRQLMATNPELAEKVANEILGNLEKQASVSTPSFTDLMEKVASIYPDEVDFLQKLAFNFADAMHAQGLSQEELEKKLQQAAFKNDPAGAIGKRVGQAADAVGSAASNAAGTISDTVLGAGDTIGEVASGAKKTVGAKAKSVKDGAKNIIDDATLKGMYAGDAIKDGAGNIVDDAALKGMYAGDAVKGGAEEAALRAMYGLDWIKANPGKSALIGGGAAGAGISAVALLNAIRNSKDEKVAAIWDAFIEKKASANESAVIMNEILKFAMDADKKKNLTANRENLRNPMDEKKMTTEQLMALKYMNDPSSIERDSGTFFRTVADYSDLEANPAYQSVHDAMSKVDKSTLFGILAGMGLGAYAGGSATGRIGRTLEASSAAKRARNSGEIILNAESPLKELLRGSRDITEGMTLGAYGGALAGTVGGGVTGRNLSERKQYPDLDPELVEQYVQEMRNIPAKNYSPK